MPRSVRVLLIFSPLFGMMGLAACGQAESSGAPTWYRDVEPIVSEHCAACHEPGGVGPVSLEFPADDPAAYASAKPIFDEAVTVLDSGQMPLWLADRSCNHYQHERGLSDAERQIFHSFVDAGSQRGDPATAAAPFVPPALRQIDARLSPESSYTPTPTPATGFTDTRCFVLDPTLTEAKDVIGFDLRPGSKRVHRAQLFSMPAASARSLDEADAGLGYFCPLGPGAEAALVGQYVPGVFAQEYPSATGIRLPAGTLLVLQVLYDLATGDPEPDRSEVELEFAPALVAHPARFEAITQLDFSVPPHAVGYSATATYAVPRASTLWGVAPHLGSYGRQAHLSATQSGANTCLLDVPTWDASWEQSYFFDHPASRTLAAGDSLTFTCTWDNPGEVALGPGFGANDEACTGYAYLSE